MLKLTLNKHIMEIWRDIEGYEGLYQVSNEGRVKSLERDFVTGNPSVVKHLEETIKKCIDIKGYYQTNLSKNGKIKHYLVHRLVAKAFIPNPNNYPCINHKDENTRNNKVENLEWCSYEYNVNYGTRNERDSQKKKGIIPKGTPPIKVYQYTINGELVKIWDSVAECGRNGFNKGAVAACCRGEHGYKTHKGYRWSYVPL